MIMAFAHGARVALHADEIIKGAISNYAFEHLPIAAYTSLIAAAKTVGDMETLRVCQQILSEEQAMAAWMLQHLSELTEAFLVRDAAGFEAKG